MIGIPLSQNKITLIDEEDYDLVKNYHWYMSKVQHKYYAATKIVINGRRTTKYLHQLLNPNWIITDHINGNGLHNYRSNLREVNHQGNMWNRKSQANSTSQYKGVYFNKQRNKWMSSITKNGHKKYLGYFNKEIEAAIAYDNEARKLFGELAYLNFPDYNKLFICNLELY